MADRHLSWFSMGGASRRRLLRDGHERIEQETPNLRRALDRARARSCGAVEMAASLMRHWVLAEHYQEARSICSAVVPAATRTLMRGACAGALRGGPGRDAERGLQGAVESTQAGLELLGDVQEPARSDLSGVLLDGVDPDRAGSGRGSAQRRARGGAREQHAEDPLGLALALVSLAVAAMLCERFERSTQPTGSSSRSRGRASSRTLRTWAEQAAAWAQVTTGSPERALEHADRGLALEGEWPSMTHFQVLSFRIHALAKLGRTDQALPEVSRRCTVRRSPARCRRYRQSSWR